MNVAAPFGGRVLIADTTVWSIVGRASPDAIREWGLALSAGKVWTSPVVVLEWLHDARDQSEFEERREHLDRLRSVPVTRSVCEAAIGALVELAAVSPGYHRVPAGDALIAASAAEHGIDVLHYDSHYDKLAEVLAFESVWLEPRGAI